MNSTQFNILLSTIKVVLDSILTVDDQTADQLILAALNIKLTPEDFTNAIKSCGEAKRDYLTRLRELYQGKVPVESRLYVVEDPEFGRVLHVNDQAFAKTPLNLNASGPAVEQSEIQEVMESYIQDRIDIWREYCEEMTKEKQRAEQGQIPQIYVND